MLKNGNSLNRKTSKIAPEWKKDKFSLRLDEYHKKYTVWHNYAKSKSVTFAITTKLKYLRFVDRKQKYEFAYLDKASLPFSKYSTTRVK